MARRGRGEGGAAALDRRGAYRCPPGTLTALDALSHTYGGLSPTIFLLSTSVLTSPHSSGGLDGTGVAGFLQPSCCHVIHLQCDLHHVEAYENTEECAKLYLGLMHSYPRSSMSSL